MVACLKKAAKLTTQVMDQTTQIQLYHELLNSYIYFFNQDHPGVRFSIESIPLNCYSIRLDRYLCFKFFD